MCKPAVGIIDAQVREIAEMQAMIEQLAARPTPKATPDLPSSTN